MRESRSQSGKRKSCGARTNWISAKSMMVEFKRVPSIFVPQESAGNAGKDEKSPKYTESGVKLSVESNRGR